MVASAAAERESSRHYTGGGSSWGHSGCGGESATTYRRALSQREERVRLEKETLGLAMRVRDLELQVRGQKSLMGEVAATADKRITELLWEAESLQARDGDIGERLERLKAEIAEKKRLVDKHFAAYIPQDARINAFSISPRKETKAAPTKESGAAPSCVGKPAAAASASKSPRAPDRWQQEIIKRAGERAVKDAKLRERSDMLREQMRGGHAPLSVAGGSSVAAKTDMSAHFVTREAWLRAHAEENAAELEERLQQKEQELRELDKSIARQKRLLKQQKQLDKYHDEELQFGKPTHRHDRVPREKVHIAGTREVNYIQEALQCIMADPNDTLRGGQLSLGPRHPSAAAGRTGGLASSVAPDELASEILAATNRDLPSMSTGSRWREPHTARGGTLADSERLNVTASSKMSATSPRAPPSGLGVSGSAFNGHASEGRRSSRWTPR
eukprot:TRINITY_DN80360_c0_g1_i1.p1 TRINITY_DN80360_c0_g1~~TRINITY_DN80360_c0_g1_i1.p1  ORF type:complete len:445 (-),score=93.40 TRINITY_DN80360_c0_g1_i1:141-1475(-)